MKEWTIEEAQDQFETVFEEALRIGPQRIRDGSRSFIVVSEEELRRLRTARRSLDDPDSGEVDTHAPAQPRGFTGERG